MVKLGSITTPLEEEHFKPKGPLPENWYKEADWVSNKEEEPTPYKVFFDYMIGGAMMEGMAGGMAVKGGGDILSKMMGMFTKMPPFLMLIQSEHPKRGYEFVRIYMSPFAIKEGPPEPGSREEPEMILRMNYYDLVRMFTGGVDRFIDPFCDGHASIDGDMSVFMQFEDMFEVFETMFGIGEEAGEIVEATEEEKELERKKEEEMKEFDRIREEELKKLG
jgi:hypothetical protein